MNLTNTKRPLRVGVFDDLPTARNAVLELLAEGFSPRHVSVVSSDESVMKSFPMLMREEPAGTNTTGAAVAGGSVGLAIGAAVGAGLVAATGGLPLLILGGLTAGAGGVVGSLMGAMMTRGVEREAADFYDQAVVEGRILVVAEDVEDDAGPPLARAERILANNGAQPLPLAEG